MTSFGITLHLDKKHPSVRNTITNNKHMIRYGDVTHGIMQFLKTILRYGETYNHNRLHTFDLKFPEDTFTSLSIIIN